jgi:hypothetical protein
LFAGSIASGSIESGEIEPSRAVTEGLSFAALGVGGMMHALFNRLRVGGAPQACVSDPETAADLLQQADEALEAAQIRIVQLTEALQGLVDLSDATRPRNMAEVRRRLVYAQRLLSARDEAAPFGCLDVAPTTSAPVALPVSVRPLASPAPPAAAPPSAHVAPPAADPPAFNEPMALSEFAALSERAAPPPFLLRVGQSESRDAEEEDLERDLDNLKKILQASWAS